MMLPVINPILRAIARILTFLLYIATLIAAFGGRVNPEISTLPAMMVLVLPWLAIATAVVAAIWIICRRYITGGLGALTIFLAISPILTACPVSFSKNPDPDGKTFTLLTYNTTNGTDLRHPDNQQGCPAYEYVLRSGADIAVLQDSRGWTPQLIKNLTPELRDSLFKKYPYHSSPDKFFDKQVLSKYPMKPVPPERYLPDDYDMRTIAFYEVDIDGRKLTIANVHLLSPGLSENERDVVKEMASVKNTRAGVSEMKHSVYGKMRSSFRKRKQDAENLRQALDRVKGDLIVCGDFNDVPESYAYRLIRGDDLRDAYAETGFGPMVTYNLNLMWFHIDQVLYRGDNLRALSVKKGDIKASDHYPLTVEFEYTPKKK